MLAVVKTGGKQYKVASGSVLKVEKLEGGVGDVVALAGVLAIVDGGKTELSADKLEKARIGAEILAQGKEDKVIVFKKKRRQNYRRKNGHRQQLTTIRIGDIALDGNVKTSSAPKSAAKKEAQPAAEKKAPAAKKEVKAEAKPEVAKKAPAAAKKPAAKKAPAKAKKDE